MSSEKDIDALQERLQSKFHEMAEKKYGPAISERFAKLDYLGRIELPDAVGEAVAKNNDKVEITLRIEDAIITEARTIVDGCGPSLVAADLVCELSEGRTPEQAMEITEQVVIDELASLPETKKYSASIAAEAIQKAAAMWLDRQN